MRRRVEPAGGEYHGKFVSDQVVNAALKFIAGVFPTNRKDTDPASGTERFVDHGDTVRGDPDHRMFCIGGLDPSPGRLLGPVKRDIRVLVGKCGESVDGLFRSPGG